MGLFDSLREKGDQIKKRGELSKKAINGESLTNEERNFFIENFRGQTPEEYKDTYDQKQQERKDKKENAEKKRTASKRERTITLKTPKMFGGIEYLSIRRDENDLFYFSNTYDENSDRFIFQSYEWEGPNVQTTIKSKTSGKTKTKGRIGSAAVGGILLGPTGAIVGASRGRKGNVNTQTTSEEIKNEKDTKAKIIFKHLISGEVKEITITNNSKTNTKIISFFDNIIPFDNDKENSRIESKKSIPDQLKEYKELLDLEIITLEEFNQKKDELLNQ